LASLYSNGPVGEINGNNCKNNDAKDKIDASGKVSRTHDDLSFGLELKDQKEGGLAWRELYVGDDRCFKHLAPKTPEGSVVHQVSSAL
jgi:hypothetical protein